eukprot:5777282-Pleurochrysis_carterae.AAC.2
MYIRSFGVPIKLTKAADMEDVSKPLCGRDFKVVAERAGEIFPELLEYVMAPQQAVEEAARKADAHAASSGSTAHANTSDVGDTSSRCVKVELLTTGTKTTTVMPMMTTMLTTLRGTLPQMLGRRSCVMRNISTISSRPGAIQCGLSHGAKLSGPAGHV